MCWQYRVVKTILPDKKEKVQIREVYISDGGIVMSISEKSLKPEGNTIAELSRQIYRYNEAYQKPIITYIQENNRMSHSDESMLIA